MTLNETPRPRQIRPECLPTGQYINEAIRLVNVKVSRLLKVGEAEGPRFAQSVPDVADSMLFNVKSYLITCNEKAATAA